MKTKIAILIIFVLIHASCKDSLTENQQSEETPRSLEDKNSSYDIGSKRGYGDMVESLYSELVEKKSQLKELEKGIDNLPGSKYDSIELFNYYKSKNQAFYSSAERHIAKIRDSVLQDKIKILIAKSFTKYNSLISHHSNVLESIETKEMNLADLHLVLKITRTLPIIEKYQERSLPSVKPLEGILKQYDNVIQLVDTLTRR